MMMINVFTDSDCIELEVSVLVLSVSPMVRSGIAVLAYAILTHGTYINNNKYLRGNCQLAITS